jgi:hypothetical protein
MADRRIVTAVSVLSWPTLVVSALWPPLDYVMTGVVLTAVLVGLVWVAMWWWGQSAAIWWENVRSVAVGRLRR